MSGRRWPERSVSEANAKRKDTERSRTLNEVKSSAREEVFLLLPTSLTHLATN